MSNKILDENWESVVTCGDMLMAKEERESVCVVKKSNSIGCRVYVITHRILNRGEEDELSRMPLSSPPT